MHIGASKQCLCFLSGMKGLTYIQRSNVARLVCEELESVVKTKQFARQQITIDRAFELKALNLEISAKLTDFLNLTKKPLQVSAVFAHAYRTSLSIVNESEVAIQGQIFANGVVAI